MPTIRENILALIATKLASAPSIGATVYRSRVTPLARGEFPAVIVEPVSDQADQPVIPYLDWRMIVRVSVMVRNDTPDQAADTIIQKVHEKMMSDLTLNGYAYDVQPVSTTWDFIESDVPTGLISYDYAVLYRTSLQDLTVV
jgi:hypothetical protein